MRRPQEAPRRRVQARGPEAHQGRYGRRLARPQACHAGARPRRQRHDEGEVMARHGIASIAPPERRCCGRRAGGPEVPGIRRAMSRKGACLDNATIEQVFGHLKGGFHRGRTFDSYERFRPGSTRKSRTGTPDGAGKSPRDTLRRNSGTCPSRPRSCILINNVQ